MISQIKSIIKDKNIEGAYYGFIRTTDEGNDYYFRKSDLNELLLEDLTIGDRVEFEPVEGKEGRAVKNLKLFTENSNIDNEDTISFDDYEKELIKNLKRIININNCDDFEDSVYLILKLIGIHKIFQFDRNSQAGKADGFFMLENMAVMYDCTLHQNFEAFKEEQIENYINKLSQKSQITFDIQKLDGSTAPRTLQISGKTKQVWIITKGESKELRDFDSIKIKEVSVHDLINTLSKRIKDPTYDVERLVNDLMFIGK
jgi:cold shock CspA family protein